MNTPTEHLRVPVRAPLGPEVLDLFRTTPLLRREQASLAFPGWRAKPLHPAKERQPAKALIPPCSWNPLRWSWLRCPCRANLEATACRINTDLYVLSHFCKQVAALRASSLRFSF